MDVFRPGPPSLLSRAQELAAEPDAAYWAAVCAWVPGTGHCRNRECCENCLFQPQRLAEADRVRRWRRLRGGEHATARR